MDYVLEYNSPFGKYKAVSDGQNIIAFYLENQKYSDSYYLANPKVGPLPVFDSLKEWLDIYFNGKIPNFLPPLDPKGSEFRQAVWKILLKIPYGKTVAYKEIAQQIAKQRSLLKMSAQAVGGAIGHNPVSIIIPCHRVIGSDGSLTGYAGGVEIKKKLLELESELSFRK